VGAAAQRNFEAVQGRLTGEWTDERDLLAGVEEKLAGHAPEGGHGWSGRPRPLRQVSVL